MRYLLGAAALIIIAAGLRATAALLIPMVLAIFLAVVTFPLVSALQRRGVHRGLAVAATMIAVLGILSGPSLLVVTAVRQFASRVPDYETRLRTVVTASLAWLRDRDMDTTSLLTLLDPGQILNLTVNMLSGLATLLSLVLLVVLICAFMLFEAADIQQQRPTVLPVRVRQHFGRIAREMQSWLVVKTVISLATGVTAGAWVALLGIEFPLLWGLTAFLLNFIPNLGSLIAAIPPAVLALIALGPLWAGVVLLGYLVINIALGSVLEPYLMGRRVGLSPLAVLLSVIAWGWMWGIAGMLLSVPITMTIKIALENAPEDLRWIARLMEGGNSGEIVRPPAQPVIGRSASDAADAERPA